MKKTLLALSAIAALTVGSAGMASAQDVGNGPGMGMGPDHDQGLREERGMTRENCRLVIMHRRIPDGLVTVRRRICD
jgi:hypothetical protein